MLGVVLSYIINIVPSFVVMICSVCSLGFGEFGGSVVWVVSVLCIVVSLCTGSALLGIRRTVRDLLGRVCAPFCLCTVYSNPVGDSMTSCMTGLSAGRIRVDAEREGLNLTCSLGRLLGAILGGRSYACVTHVSTSSVSVPRHFIGRVTFVGSRPSVSYLNA